MTQKTVCSLLITFLLSVPVLAQTPSVTPAKVNIIIDRETVRFAPQEAAQELRLVITDQTGAELYDSGALAVATLDWPLRDTQGEAVKGGLYLYTLTIKDGAGELSQRRGYLIVNRTGDADGIWLATSDKIGVGAGSEAAQLAVIGNRDVTLGRAELPGSAPPRAALGERSDLPQRKTDGIGNEKNEKAAAAAAAASTANQVAKFASDGVSLIDSAISEVSGNVGIGTTAPQSGLDYRHALAPFFTRDIGTTNFGGTQSALQLGVSNLGSRNVNVGPAFLFFADNSAGAKSFLGRVAGAWENPTAGAEAGYLRFQVRANSGDTGASTERMRITASGNVGIGTTNPSARLQVASAGDNATSYTARFQSSPSVYGAGGILFDQGSTYGWKVHTENTGFTTGTLNFNYVNIANGASLTANPLVLSGDGNVGIGTNSPTSSKLQVYDTSVGTAVYGVSTVGGGGVSAGGSGVVGESQSGNGFGVYGRNLFGGFAMFAEGHAGQSRNKGGWVKAMLKVNADGGIVRCYNGITGAAGGTCGFSALQHPDFQYAYDINFGFKVDDRFVSVTTDTGSFATNASVIYGFGNENTIRVVTQTGTGFYPDTGFTIIVY